MHIRGSLWGLHAAFTWQTDWRKGRRKKRDCVHVSTLLNIVIHVRFTTTLIINLFDKGTWRPYLNFSIHQKLLANHSKHTYIYFQLYRFSSTYRYLFYTANNITIIILIIFLLLLCFMCYVMWTCIIEPFTNYSKCWIRFEMCGRKYGDTCSNSSIFLRSLTHISATCGLLNI